LKPSLLFFAVALVALVAIAMDLWGPQASASETPSTSGSAADAFTGTLTGTLSVGKTDIPTSIPVKDNFVIDS
jgi:hypothetical protein